MEVARPEKQAERTNVEHALADFSRLPWEPAGAIGEGEEYRAESPNGDQATALVLGGTVVHGSVVCAFGG